MALDADQVRTYEVFRKRIVDEDNLIHARVMWLIISESMLIALFGALISISPSNFYYRGLGVVVDLAGILITALGFFAIRAAQFEIKYIVRFYKEKHSDVANDGLVPALTGQDANHKIGHLVPYSIPIIIAVVWVMCILFIVAWLTGMAIVFKPS